MMKVPPITGVAEIVLNAQDLPKLRDFYQEMLGFQLLDESCHESEDDPAKTGAPTITFLVIADAETPLGRNGHPQLLAIIDYNRHAASKKNFEAVSKRTSTLNHIAFEIPPESYEDHIERLELHGLNPLMTTFPNLSAKAIFFKDPEGNTIELICHDASCLS